MLFFQINFFDGQWKTKMMDIKEKRDQEYLIGHFITILEMRDHNRFG